MTKVKTSFLAAMFVVFALAASMIPGLMAQPEVAYAADASKYSSSALVDLPDDGVVAKVSWLNKDGNIDTETFGFDAGANTATRAEVNKKIVAAWQRALDYSYDMGKQFPNPEFDVERFVRMDLYVDWIAVDGKFGSGGNGFDGGEIEVDGTFSDSSLLLDLHGCTLDRGSSQANPYGRVLDIDNDSSNFALVSSDKQGVVTGGWDGDGGAIRTGRSTVLYMDNVHVTGNHAENGGAVFVKRAAMLKARNCEFSYNTAESRGGAISNETNLLYLFGLIDLSNCSLHHNTSQGLAGAIDINDTGNILRQEISYIRGCDIYANSAKTKGGGVFVECDSLLEIHGKTHIHGNYAGEKGGGLFLESYANDDAEAILHGDVAVYGNTAGSDRHADNAHLDAGTTSAARLELDESFAPTVATGVYSTDSQVVAKSDLSASALTDALVASWFYSDDPDRYVEKKSEGSSEICTKDKSDAEAGGTVTEIGDLTSFVVTSGLPAIAMPLPEKTVIDNGKREVTLVFSTLNAVDLPKTLGLRMSSNLTNGSLIDLDCDGPDKVEEKERLAIDLSASPQGKFRVYDSSGNSFEEWTVVVMRDGTLYGETVMTVTDSAGTTSITTDAVGDPFAEGWKTAIEKLESSDVTVKLYRDWTAVQGVFSDESHAAFNNGRLAVKNSNGSVLTIDLNGHVIDRNLDGPVEHGQVLRLSSNAKVNLVDTSKYGGGAIVGGNNSGINYGGSGGAVYMVDSAQLTIENVTLSGNVAVEGAGVYLTDNAKLILKDGALIENNTAENGGGIYIAGGDAPTLSIEGGTVFGNSASNAGGAIYSAQSGLNGNVEMTAGSVSGNTAKNGGGIYWAGKGTLNLIGGSIIDNTAANKGGGVFADSDGSDVKLGGSIRIMRNAADGEDSNLTLENEGANLRQSQAFSEDAKIGVNMLSGYGKDNKDQISSDPDTFRAGSSAYLRSDDPDYGVVAYANADDAALEEIHLVADSESGQWEKYTLTLADWHNGMETVVETISAGEGEAVTLHADTSSGLIFVGWDVEPQGQSVTHYYEPTLTYVMPACDVVVRGNYMTRVSAVAVSDIEQPKVGMALDGAATVKVALPVDVDGDGDVDSADVISFGDIVVTWKNAGGKSVDAPTDAGVYTGTIVLLDSAKHGIVFNNQVTATGTSDMWDVGADVLSGACTITFKMQAQPAVVTEALQYAPTDPLIVKEGTSAEAVCSQLPKTLDVMTDAGVIPVGVTWSCGDYGSATAGSYGFVATFDLDGASVSNPNKKVLSAVVTVKVVEDSVPLPVVDKNPDVYDQEKIDLVLSVGNASDDSTAASNYALYYRVKSSVSAGDSSEPAFVAAEGGEANISLARNPKGEVTYTVEAYVAPAAASHAALMSNGEGSSTQPQNPDVVTFQYTIMAPLYEVSVEGGTLGDGSKAGEFRAGTSITLKANGLTPGHYFIGWFKNDAEEAVSTEMVATEIVDGNAIYEAQYGNRLIASVSARVSAPQAGAGFDDKATCAFRYDDGQASTGDVGASWFVQNEDGTWSEVGATDVVESGAVYKVVLSLGEVGGNVADDASFTLNNVVATEGWNAEEGTLSYVFSPVPVDPGDDPEGGDTPGGDDPEGGDTPGGDTPGGDTPGGDTPGGNVPGEGDAPSKGDGADTSGESVMAATGDSAGVAAMVLAGVSVVAVALLAFAVRRMA